MDELQTTILKLDSERLARLFELGRNTNLESANALQESLEHLLSLPLANALNQMPRALASELGADVGRAEVLDAATRSGIKTFGDLFVHPKPPLDALVFAKEFGKAIINHRETELPAKVGQVFNYAAYAAGLLRWGKRIGSLSDTQLQKGFKQLARFPWLDRDLRGLLEAAQAKLTEGDAKEDFNRQ